MRNLGETVSKWLQKRWPQSGQTRAVGAEGGHDKGARRHLGKSVTVRFDYIWVGWRPQMAESRGHPSDRRREISLGTERRGQNFERQLERTRLQSQFFAKALSSYLVQTWDMARKRVSPVKRYKKSNRAWLSAGLWCISCDRQADTLRYRQIPLNAAEPARSPVSSSE